MGRYCLILGDEEFYFPPPDYQMKLAMYYVCIFQCTVTTVVDSVIDAIVTISCDMSRVCHASLAEANS